MPKTINNITQLRQVLRRPALTKWLAYQVVINIEGLPENIKSKLEKLSNHYLGSCGCKEGTITSVLLLVWGLILRPDNGWIISSVLPDMIIIFFIGAIAGKLGTYIFLRLRIEFFLLRFSKQIP